MLRFLVRQYYKAYIFFYSIRLSYMKGKTYALREENERLRKEIQK